MPENTGWVKIHRKILDSGILQNGNLTAFWVWCLLKATHRPFKTTVGNQCITLKPGEFVFKRIVAVQELSLSEKTVRTCLDILKNGQQITVKPTNKFSIITIINWGAYQCFDSDEGPTNIPQRGQQRANKGPTNDSIPIIDKNIKNYKNIETINVVSYAASFPDKPEISMDAEPVIQNYQWYHDQYNAIQAQYNNIRVLPENSQERVGAMMVLNNAIGEYNSRSKQITRNFWKSDSLPYQIYIEDFK